MKGVIAQCLRDLVKDKFGNEKWDEILDKSDLPRSTMLVATMDLPDELVMKVLENTCAVLGISLEQAADAFGQYWVCTFAPKVYPSFYRDFSSARDYLQKMDDVHERTTRITENAQPPRFDYDWQDDNTLVMHYKSHRNLMPIFVGLIKGVGDYFKENLTVQIVSDSQVRIQFPA